MTLLVVLLLCLAVWLLWPSLRVLAVWAVSWGRYWLRGMRRT